MSYFQLRVLQGRIEGNLMERLGSRTVDDSKAESANLMMPSDAIPSGKVFGGVIAKYVDEIGSLVAKRHSHRLVVLASIYHLNFFKPVHIGNFLILKASLNYVGRTSMEVGVRIEAEDTQKGTVTHVGTAFLTYVALNEKARPTPVPRLILKTREEKMRWKGAERRRMNREKALGSV